ncbi:longevity assurance proteins LAG1/LAC1 [Mycena vitilis]|nr:longevity assurance proteins LAG1/LAC1 [Mycena vitilis]
MISTARQKPKGPIDDPSHHLTGPFTPSAPPSPAPPPPATAPRLPSASGPHSPKPSLARGAPAAADVSPLLRWAVDPLFALRALALPPLLALPTALLLPLVRGCVPAAWVERGWVVNPFTPFFLLSHASAPPARASASPLLPAHFATTQHYVKGPLDLLVIAYSVVGFSLLRLVLSNWAFPALAGRYGIRKPGKVLRFGEQGYAVCYFAVVGVWGMYIQSTSRTGWFHTGAFWADYPHTHLSGAMKRYYLSQIAYWLQQALVLLLGLEARRSDYWEFVVHHVVTVWMVTWSYLMNVTLLGTAVFVSMDVPDVLLAFSKMLNYLALERAKVVSFGVFVVVWTYFRHYISLRILWSLQYEFDYVPKYAQIFSPLTGLYMAPWMRDQMFYSLCVLQVLNCFWYYLILRILVRSIMTSETDDNRSDAEEDDVASLDGDALNLDLELDAAAGVGGLGTVDEKLLLGVSGEEKSSVFGEKGDRLGPSLQKKTRVKGTKARNEDKEGQGLTAVPAAAAAAGNGGEL